MLLWIEAVSFVPPKFKLPPPPPESVVVGLFISELLSPDEGWFPDEPPDGC